VTGGFLDTFDDPGSGWAIDDNTVGSFGYAGGEYFIGAKQAGYLDAAAAPDVSRENYVVEVDAHWAAGSADNGLYGVIFGANSAFSQYYFLAILPSTQQARVFFYNSFLPAGQNLRLIANVTAGGVINSGTAANHLQLSRVGSSIKVMVNGSDLGTWSDGALTGQTWTGLLTSPQVSDPVTEARFDNFSLSYCDTSAGVGSAAISAGGDRADARYDSAGYVQSPVVLSWPGE
jgi:hypothetical protein